MDPYNVIKNIMVSNNIAYFSIHLAACSKIKKHYLKKNTLCSWKIYLSHLRSRNPNTIGLKHISTN